MIFDSASNIDRYFGLGKNIDEGLNFLKKNRFNSSLFDGKYEIIPNEVYAIVTSAKTSDEELKKHEIHFKYMDMQYIISGVEKCYIAKTVERASVETNDEDFLFVDAKDNCQLLVKEDDFYMVWPYEPHKPTCLVDGVKDIRKIIVKVRID